jgi:addiction module RelE/StbE family toxin
MYSSSCRWVICNPGTLFSKGKSKYRTLHPTGQDSCRQPVILIVAEHDNPDAAQYVKDDIEAKARKLPDFPKMGRLGRVEGTRELVVLANYLLVYQEDALTIRILRVLHAAQQWPQTD